MDFSEIWQETESQFLKKLTFYKTLCQQCWLSVSNNGTTKINPFFFGQFVTLVVQRVVPIW